MASSSNPSSSHANSGFFDPGASTGIVAISSCIANFQYSLYVVNTVLPAPTVSWVSDHNIVPEPWFAKFPNQDVAEDIEPKAFEIASSITSKHLSEFRSLYHIP